MTSEANVRLKNVHNADALDDDIILYASTSKDSYTIKMFLEIAQTYTPAMPVIFDENGMRFYITGMKVQYLFDFFIPISRFEKYICKQKIEFNINTALMNATMKSIKKKKNILTFKISRKDLENKNLDIILPLSRVITDTTHIPFMNTLIKMIDMKDGGFCINVPASYFQEAIKNTSNVDGHRKIIITIKKGILSILTNSEKLSRNLDYNFTKNEDYENASDEEMEQLMSEEQVFTFSNISLYKLQKLGSIQWVNDTLKLTFYQGSSMMISAEFDNAKISKNNKKDESEDETNEESDDEEKESDESGTIAIVLAPDELLEESDN